MTTSFIRPTETPRPRAPLAASQIATKRRLRLMTSYERARAVGLPPGCAATRSKRGASVSFVSTTPATWNRENPPSPHRVPLPFLLTDDTIYQRAPSVVLGTIDKLALIGQHDRTINAIVGMLGVARFMDPDNRHLHMPRGARALTRDARRRVDAAETRLCRRAAVFHDPFPSLIIQDEGHLLEESLGTFSGLLRRRLKAS